MNQVTLNDIGTPEDFLKAIDESMREYFVGDKVLGTVVQIDREGVLQILAARAKAISQREKSQPRDYLILRMLSQLVKS